MGTSIWLYIHQITALEKDFSSLRNGIAALRKRLADDGSDETRKAVKFELDLLVRHVRILKEQASCIKQIGRQFDVAFFLKKVLLFLHAIDPDICFKAIAEINKVIEAGMPDDEGSG